MQLNDVLETIKTGPANQHKIELMYAYVADYGKHVGDIDGCQVLFVQFEQTDFYGLFEDE